MKEMNKIVSSFADISIDIEISNKIEAIKNTAEYQMKCDLEKKERQQELKECAMAVQNDLEELLNRVDSRSRDIKSPIHGRSNNPLARQKRRSLSTSPRKNRNKSKRKDYQGVGEINEKIYDNPPSFTKGTQDLNNMLRNCRDPLIAEMSAACGKSYSQILPPILNLNSYPTNTISWYDVEKQNLRLLLSSRPKKFFRVDVTQEQIAWSLQNKGFFLLSHNLYQILCHCARKFSKYFLLQEHAPASPQVNLLVGIAQVCEPIPVLSDSSKKIIYVQYLCLSRSGINLRVFNSNNREVVDSLLKTYLQTIEDKLVQPFVPDIFPYSELQPPTNSLINPDTNVDPNRSGADTYMTDIHHTEKKIQNTPPAGNEVSQTFANIAAESVVETEQQALTEHSNNAIKHLNYAVYWYENLLGGTNSEQRKEVPPGSSELLSCSHKSSPPLLNLKEDILDWISLEHDNLEEIHNIVNSKFFICDVTYESITKSIYNKGCLCIEPFITGLLEKCSDTTSVYLVLRLIERKSASKKAVVGIAKLLSNCCDGLRELVRVTYLCLSCPVGVDAPWCEEEHFTNGQELVHGEERILVNEYKLSLRRRKVKALLADVYPWSVRCSTQTSVPTLYQRQSQQHTLSDECKTSLASEPDPHLSFTVKSKSTVLRNVEPIDSLVKRSSPSKDDRNHSKSTELHKPQLQNQGKSLFVPASVPKLRGKVENSSDQKPCLQLKLPSSSTKRSEEHVLSHTGKTSNVIPPLKNLFVSGKKLTQDCWEAIEYKNLASTLNLTTSHDFFLCQTDVSAIRRSFRSSELEISARNVQNVTSAVRTRKFLILRTFFRNQKRNAIVGVANVSTSADVRMDSKKKDCFLVTISYYCLSVPALKANILTSSDWCDGMEISSDVLSGVFKQYMIALQRRNVYPLFKDIFPWSLIPPDRYRKSSGSDRMPSTSSSVSVISEPDTCAHQPSKSHVETSVNVETVADDNLLTYLDSGRDSGINFAQIDQELSRCRHTFDGNTVDKHLYQPLKFQYQTSMAVEANKFKQYARNAANELYFSPPTKINHHRPVPKLTSGRGRGRGMLLMKHVGLLP